MAKNYFKSYIWLLETLQTRGRLTLKEIKDLWMKLFPSILDRRHYPDEIPSCGRTDVDKILRESYGFLVYEEQAVLLKQTGFSVESPLKRLVHKGHNIARTMFAVEAVTMTRQ